MPTSKPGATSFFRLFSYKALGGGWGELMEWMKAEGYEAGPTFWERYLAGPETGPDPSKWRTELNRSLAEGD